MHSLKKKLNPKGKFKSENLTYYIANILTKLYFILRKNVCRFLGFFKDSFMCNKKKFKKLVKFSGMLSNFVLVKSS